MELLRSRSDLTSRSSSTSSCTTMISEDLIAEIFLWLPLESINRSKCLSKRWYELISQNKSSFRLNYLSSFTTRQKRRIIGTHDSPSIMLGFFYQNRSPQAFLFHNSDPVRFMPTWGDLMKEKNQRSYWPFSSIKQQQEEEDEEDEDNFLQLILSTDHHLLRNQNVFIRACSNGFLVCTLEIRNPVNYYVCNPVTREWVHLPKPTTVGSFLAAEIGFLCKGEYPCLDLVEFTVVRVIWRGPGAVESSTYLPIEIFSSGDDQWRQFNVTGPGWFLFELAEQQKPVIIATAGIGNNDVVMYCIVRFDVELEEEYERRHAVVVFSIKDLLDQDKEESARLKLLIVAPRMDPPYCDDETIEELDGVLHLVRCAQGGEVLVVWSLVDHNEWVLKHKLDLRRIIERYPSIRPEQWKGENDPVRIEGFQEGEPKRILFQSFHPLEPKMILLTVYRKKVWCNLESETLELAADFYVREELRGHYYFFYAYRWPCWPPLL